jgi:hypothetical protein
MTGPVSVAGLSGGEINDTMEESDVLVDNPGAVEELDMLVDENEVDWAVLDWPDDPGDALDAAVYAEDADPELLWVALPLELDAEDVNVGNMLEGEDAGAASDELDVEASLEVEADEGADAESDKLDVEVSLEVETDEEGSTELVDLNTPLYVVAPEEGDVTEHTSDEQQGILVLVAVAVENAPP